MGRFNRDLFFDIDINDNYDDVNHEIISLMARIDSLILDKYKDDFQKSFKSKLPVESGKARRSIQVRTQGDKMILSGIDYLKYLSGIEAIEKSAYLSNDSRGDKYLRLALQKRK